MSAGVTAKREVALPLADLPPGASTNVKVFGYDCGVQRRRRTTLRGGQQLPPHGGPLCHGRVPGTHPPFRPHAYRYGCEGRGLACPWHGWEFDIQSGQTPFDPAVRGKVYEVGVEDGQILLTRRRGR